MFSDYIIKFKRDTSFRQEMMTPESFAHPAKLDAQLLLWLVEKFTPPGETILDPMFGSGTLMLACTLGRHVIGVELEQKFVNMAQKNWEKVRQRPQLGHEMGTCQILQGDARNLNGLLADSIVTSPPYSDMSMGGGLNIKPSRPGHNDQTGRSPHTPSQAGAGKYDTIITSPPFQEVEVKRSGQKTSRQNYSYGSKLKMSGEHPDNISKLAETKYGSIDSVITSPPYENQAKGISQKEYEKKQAIINKVRRERGDISGGIGRSGAMGKSVINPDGYSDATNNIGNMKGETYLQAMAQIYLQCHAVLKPGGLMILITKNFIRDQKEIRLDLDTIRLCGKAGFTFIERWYRELPAQSFWRILYKRRFPDAPELKFEDVLVFRKRIE